MTCPKHRTEQRTVDRRLAPPRVPESVVQAHGVQLLRSLRAIVFVIGHPSPSDGRRHRGTGQTPGLPDVLAFLPPAATRSVLLWWEAKAQGGRLRPEQAAFRDLCAQADVAHVVGDLDALIAWLVAHDYCRIDQFPHYRQPPTGAPA